MKTLGDVRPIDKLGRITVPKDIRDRFKLIPGTEVGVFADDKLIYVKRLVEGCVFCGDEEDLLEFEKRKVCKNCMGKLKK